MTKLALLKNVSFNVTTNQLQLYLADKVLFCEFDGTINLFNKIHELLGDNMIEVQNCDYDEKYLVQAFYVENTDNSSYDNIILVKREIIDNDTYTYLGLENQQSSDKFVFSDVNFDDIEKILRRKMECKAVIVKEFGDICNIVYSTTYNKNSSSGKIKIKMESGNEKEFTFLNVNSIMIKEQENNTAEDQLNDILLKKIEETNSTFLYSQHEFPMGILNLYSPVFGKNKNNTMSNFTGSDFYGDIVVCLENHLNEDSRILDMNIETFVQILELSKINDFKPKNHHFCNIFYELSKLNNYRN